MTKPNVHWSCLPPSRCFSRPSHLKKNNEINPALPLPFNEHKTHSHFTAGEVIVHTRMVSSSTSAHKHHKTARGWGPDLWPLWIRALLSTDPWRQDITSLPISTCQRVSKLREWHSENRKQETSHPTNSALCEMQQCVCVFPQCNQCWK